MLMAMKGSPHTTKEYADQLEHEAIEQALEQEGATVEDIQEIHAEKIQALFEDRAEANSEHPEVVKQIRKEMMEALHRVDELATKREASVEAGDSEDAAEIELVNLEDPDDLEVGKFAGESAETAA